jgi:hypothetical protein
VTAARVIRCTYGRVDLPLIMDVQSDAAAASAAAASAAAAAAGVLSHEAPPAQRAWAVGGAPHFHNRATHAGFDASAAAGGGPAHAGGGGGAGLVTVSLRSDAPLRLAAWQVPAAGPLAYRNVAKGSRSRNRSCHRRVCVIPEDVRTFQGGECVRE